MKSIDAFLWDAYISSFRDSDSLREASRTLNEEEKASVARAGLGDHAAWCKMYDDRREYLSRSCLVTDKDGKKAPEKVSFHEQFGWVMEGSGVKAYLGKASFSGGINIEIGNRAYISGQSTLRGNAHLRIGSFTCIAEGFYANVQSDRHPLDYPAIINFRTNVRLREDGLSLPLNYGTFFTDTTLGIDIGSDVWIGRNVRLSHGITIGDGCVIAEGSLVKSDCEPYGIYGGWPAKLIRYRFSQKRIQELLDVRWWEWEKNKITTNELFFDTDLNEDKRDIKFLIK